jgi:putative ABC transport system permease protein
VPLVVILSLPFLYLLATRRVLRRLAIRNASRRPRETALVLLGSLLGTAIITGSLVVGDTLDSSFRQAAYSHQGPIDELVETRAVSLDALWQRLSTVKSPDIDGLLPMVTASASAMTADADVRTRKAQPNSRVVEVDFAQARAFGNDPDATGISGPTPGPGHAVVGKDLARSLEVDAGDRIVVSTFGRQLTLEVDRVLPRKGIAGFRLDVGSESHNVLVAPGTIEPLAAAAASGAAPPQRFVAVSNKGGIIDGAALSSRVEPVLRAALGDVPARIEAIKRNTLDDARENGKQFTQLFAGIGFFSVLAGILLLVNIFVMLAQERKTELGMLRAVGLRRASLVGGFSLEGWLYALASSMLGTIAGLGVGRLIVAVAAGIFSQPGEVFSLELRYSARLSSVLNGFSTGFVISLFTVVVTSLMIARLNIIRAIRDLPEPPGSRRSRLVFDVLGGLAVVAGVQLFVVGVMSDAPAAVLIGPALVAVGAVRLLRRFVPERPLRTAAASFVLVLSITGFDLFPSAFEDAQIPVFVVLGVILTGAAVALVTVNQEPIARVLRRVGGGSDNMSLRLGLAYPLARRFRTGMILSMYSLVVFTLVFMTVFSHLFANQIDTFTANVSGGYHVRVDSNPSNPIPVPAVLGVPGVARAAAVSNALGEFSLRCDKCSDGFEDWPASTFGPDFVDGGPPVLTKRLAQYADDETAYRALLTDPTAFIPTQFFLQTGGGPPERTIQLGDVVVLRDPESGQTRELHVTAIAESGFGNLMALVSPVVMRDLFGPRATPNALFVAVASGADPDRVADAINGRFVENGADAGSFRSIVSANLGQQTQFFRLIQGYLALGLLVGIAGLGVVMVRAVRERRREVGVLRALGFESRAVRRAFVAESAFVALEGITIGTVLALITAWRLVGNDTFGATLAFSVPVLQLLVLVLGTFAASLVATVTPAQQASRIKPAVALRIAD